MLAVSDAVFILGTWDHNIGNFEAHTVSSTQGDHEMSPNSRNGDADHRHPTCHMPVHTKI